MKDWTAKHTKIHQHGLHEELQAKLGDKYHAMSTWSTIDGDLPTGEFIIHLADDATDEDGALVDKIVAAHDHAPHFEAAKKAAEETDPMSKVLSMLERLTQRLEALEFHQSKRGDKAV